jgi:hypothetical protein
MRLFKRELLKQTLAPTINSSSPYIYFSHTLLPFTAKPTVRSRVNSREIRDGRRTLEKVFPPSFFGFPLLVIIASLLHEVCDTARSILSHLRSLSWVLDLQRDIRQVAQ